MTAVDDDEIEFEVCGDNSEIDRLEALKLEEDRIMNTLRKTVRESKQAEAEALQAAEALTDAETNEQTAAAKASSLERDAALAENRLRQRRMEEEAERIKKAQPPPIDYGVIIHMATQILTQQWEHVLNEYNFHLTNLQELFFEGIHDRRYFYEMSCTLVEVEVKHHHSSEQTKMSRLVAQLQEIIHSQSKENVELQREISELRIENEKMNEDLKRERDFEGAVKGIEESQKRLAQQQSTALAARGLTCGSLLAVSMADEDRGFADRLLQPSFPPSRDYSLPRHWQTEELQTKNQDHERRSKLPSAASHKYYSEPQHNISATTAETSPSRRDLPGLQNIDYSSNYCLLPSGIHPAQRARLIRFYEKYDRSKLPTVANTLKRFKGKERALFAALVQQYGPEPGGAVSSSSGTDDPIARLLTPEEDPLPQGWVREENIRGDLYYKHEDGLRQQWHRPVEDQMSFRTWL